MGSTEIEKPQVQGPCDASQSELLRIEAIRKSFQSSGSQIQILKGIHMRVTRAETIGVVGASGIGKSTLLHIIGTLERPDSGKLWFNSEDVFTFNETRLARFRNQSIGFVFQFHHLLSEFSAIENTMMPALIQGIRKTSAKKMAEEMLVRVGLQSRLHHKAVELSGGEQQRVALARALVLKPDLLLADEPTGNLDKQNGDRVHELLLQLNQELGMTLIVVTHNNQLAATLSRRVTIVDGELSEAVQ
jgi:lipoprotein-releasing system ATP-binding protein